MNSLNSLAAIISAVKEPITLAALVVLCLTLILRIILSKKIKSLRGTAAYRTTIYSITVIFFLSLVTIVGALGYNFIKLYFEHSSKQPILTRLEAENVVQKNRGNIERCIKELASCLYVDFVFELHSGVGINVDIFVNTMAGSFDWEVVHPRWMIPNEFSGVGAYSVTPINRDKIPAHPGKKQKLSVTYPEVNKCIIESLKDDLNNFTLSNNLAFIHRYITDRGKWWAENFRREAPEIPLQLNAPDYPN